MIIILYSIYNIFKIYTISNDNSNINISKYSKYIRGCMCFDNEQECKNIDPDVELALNHAEHAYEYPKQYKSSENPDNNGPFVDIFDAYLFNKYNTFNEIYPQIMKFLKLLYKI